MNRTNTEMPSTPEAQLDVTAIYFPSYHQDEHYDRWYGEGWSEWKLMEERTPLFPGHEQPKLCSWGSFDEADPLWMEKQIDLAADHGITSFNWDWYWYSGTKFLHRALEDGFLKARNRNRLKFFIMWANHTWGVFPACREIFKGHETGEAVSKGQALSYDQPLLEIKHTMEDLREVAEYCCDRYFGESNYHTIDGKPIFCFWRWDELESQLGGVEAVKEGFEMMRDIARRRGYPGLHIIVNIACYEGPETLYCWWPALIEKAKAAGADSVYGYNIARSKNFPNLTEASPLVPHKDVLESQKELFRICEDRGLPFHPVATIGFDNTPRWHRGAKFPFNWRSQFYEPIVVDNPPSNYRLAIEEALRSIDQSGGGARMLLLNAWNEWPEGNQLLPTTLHGTAYIETLKQTLDDWKRRPAK